jgi:hypothetical protein
VVTSNADKRPPYVNIQNPKNVEVPTLRIILFWWFKRDPSMEYILIFRQSLDDYTKWYQELIRTLQIKVNKSFLSAYLTEERNWDHPLDHSNLFCKQNRTQIVESWNPHTDGSDHVVIHVLGDESGAEDWAYFSVDTIQFSLFFPYHHYHDHHFHWCIVIFTLRSERNRN